MTLRLILISLARSPTSWPCCLYVEVGPPRLTALVVHGTQSGLQRTRPNSASLSLLPRRRFTQLSGMAVGSLASSRVPALLCGRRDGEELNSTPRTCSKRSSPSHRPAPDGPILSRAKSRRGALKPRCKLHKQVGEHDFLPFHRPFLSREYRGDLRSGGIIFSLRTFYLKRVWFHPSREACVGTPPAYLEPKLLGPSHPSEPAPE